MVGINLYDIVSAGFAYQNVKILKDNRVNKISALGTPIWMDLTFESFRWYEKVYDSDGGFEEINHMVPKIHIPCCIVEASGTKTIVKTAIQGLNIRGTEKEYINHGDINISIKGAIVNDANSKYPTTEVNALYRLIAAPVSLKVNHTFLNQVLDVQSLVIEGYNFPSKQGMENVQLFELNCISDQPFELLTK